jgi:hypothetical protein
MPTISLETLYARLERLHARANRVIAQTENMGEGTDPSTICRTAIRKLVQVNQELMVLEKASGLDLNSRDLVRKCEELKSLLKSTFS